MKISKHFKPLFWSLGSFLVIVLIILAFKGPYFILIKYHYYNGYSKQKSNDYEGAITAYTKVLDYDKSYTTAYISRGSAYLDLRKYNEAIADYSEAIKQNPTNAKAYAYRGRAYYEIKDSINSLNDYDKSISLDGKFAYAYYQRGLLKYSVLKQFEDGCSDLKISLQLGMTEAKELIDNGGCN